MGSIHDFTVKTIDGETLSLGAFKGKAALIVNVASQCGFTSQYRELEELQHRFAPRGFSVLGFPCNQFGGQEPGTESDIKEFCQLNFRTTFPLFAKIEVNGGNADPLYMFLKEKAPGVLGTEGIKWNFTKFLVSRDGAVIARYAPTTSPLEIADDIERALV